MTRKVRLFTILLLIPIVGILSGLIGALFKLINIQTILISLFILAIYSNSKAIRIFKVLAKKGQFYLRKHKDYKTIPKNKNDAARRSLKSIDQLTSLIQNQIAAQALRYEKQRVEKELLRGDLLVAVFGPGSSGKTALVRSLLNKIVGHVAPSMGSTTKTNIYRLKLKSLRRGLKIIDTPGILEGGVHGRSREKEAIIKASQADLIIFVVDSDLRSYEMEMIVNLSKVGKKLFIVLNKSDLRGEKEKAKLISLLENRTQGIVDIENIIATSASPQTIPIIGSNPLQPKPDINQLIKRMAIVLHQEGEELIADNILLQCRNLGTSGRRLLDKQRLATSQRCVERYTWISSGVVFITPLPVIDLLGAAVVNGRMVMDISKIYGVELTKDRAKSLAMSVGQTIAGLGIVKGGVSLISNSLSLHLPTYLVGKTIQSVSAAWLTQVAGESFITYFQQDQNWGDGGVQEVVQHHYNLNRREYTLRAFIRAAMNRVIEPLEKKINNKQLPSRPRPPEEEEAWGLEHRE
ncbi:MULTISPECIES: YcjF family protein [Prochlorococcus]|uniref:Membrane associated GTPase n=1 Tax=Prochlorococcus marinus (strain SARG / CCMP1375 / SS120) TaxID=167539 RepID=Q7VBQ9_PROMA|nr:MULTISPECIES: GTP-binding protein [Prochlorococcus]AAQ00078.1 Membrane associated GTPase [Prochlorococcus marinus subsp. marinus str. CCMP1375]KGG13875.1 hypothetical protein EV04_0360 [Prochlorococcus marinus str. LG]KGG19008.1 hypothetical protein EV08_1495 [Prochlorococcus marinus str. SS2]KGG23452.1 hypothetical protein EV09_1076 [Prochlorococcus marinus str. SS35]KGG32312.1 hypothetical protein EV10_1427 [Prochlorococcus marinus str. SS51]